MRASVWVVVLLGALGVATVAVWTGRDGARPAPARLAAAGAEAAAATPGPAPDESDAGASAGARPAREAGASGPLALARDRMARAGVGDGAGPGGADAGPGDTRGREAGAARAPATLDRDLERSVARLGQDLDLPSLPRTAGSRAEALGDEGYVAEVADAAMVEYLMRDALWREFHAHNKLVPWGFPLDALRSSLATELAGLSTAERNALLALVEERLPQQAPPIMSKHVRYEGPGFEGSPSGVEVFE